MDRSASAVMVWVEVTRLFAGVGSVTPAGAAMVAVLLMVPLAAPAMVALTVKVGRASCRGRVEVSVVAVSLKKKMEPAEAARGQATKGRLAGAGAVSVGEVTDVR